MEESIETKDIRQGNNGMMEYWGERLIEQSFRFFI